jgi:hypothetical protein
MLELGRVVSNQEMVSNRETYSRCRRAASSARSTLAIALLAASVAVMLLSSDARGEGARRAHDARTLNVTDTAHLRYVRSSGSALVEEGAATGGLPGTVKVSIDVGATVSASFAIYAHGGSLIGEGSGKLHGTGVYASFGGSMTVSRGTGRYAHAHGHGGFYGTINRNTYALTVQTTGALSY